MTVDLRKHRDPLAEHAAALRALARGIDAVADTLQWQNAPGDTISALFRLAPRLRRVAETMQRMPR